MRHGCSATPGTCCQQLQRFAGLPCHLLQVEEAGERVEQELTAALATVDDYAHSSDMRSLRPSLVHDPVNNAVWIKLPKGSQVECLPAQSL